MSGMNVLGMTIVIPSLNPDDKFYKTLDSILDRGFYRIVVVDDGSDLNHEEPFRYAKKRGCVVLRHELNRGKGAALKTAFKYCMKQETCFAVITVDGDGQHSADDIYRCGEAIYYNGFKKVILGCRDFSEPQVPFKSKYGNNITKFAFRALCGIKISDTQTGLRAIPAYYLKRIVEMKGERFEYETNMLLEMKKQGIPFEEVKIETIYLDDNASTHFHPIRDSFMIYKTIFAYSMNSIISSGLDLLMYYIFLNAFITCGTAKPIVAATLFARMASSLFNFGVNKGLVFKSTSGSAITKYYFLCFIQGITSALLVNGFTYIAPVTKSGSVLVKLVVDTLLFFISYRVQKEWVFKDVEEKEESWRLFTNRYTAIELNNAQIEMIGAFMKVSEGVEERLEKCGEMNTGMTTLLRATMNNSDCSHLAKEEVNSEEK